MVGSLFGDAVLEMPYYHCMHGSLDGIPVVLGRTGWTGEIGYEIYLQDPARGDERWERVMEAGAANTTSSRSLRARRAGSRPGSSITAPT